MFSFFNFFFFFCYTLFYYNHCFHFGCYSHNVSTVVGPSLLRWHVVLGSVSTVAGPSLLRWHVVLDNVSTVAGPSLLRWHVVLGSVSTVAGHSLLRWHVVLGSVSTVAGPSLLSLNVILRNVLGISKWIYLLHGVDYSRCVIHIREYNLHSSEPLHMDEQRQDDQLESIYNSSVPIKDVALKTYWEWWSIEKVGRKESERSVLAVRHDGDDDEDRLCSKFA